MKFRKLSVAGYAWLHDFDLQEEAAKLEESREGDKNREAEKIEKKKGKGIMKLSSTRKRTERIGHVKLYSPSITIYSAIWLDQPVEVVCSAI